MIKMKEYEAIQYLENLEVGSFLTVNFPIDSKTVMPVTALYMGKDKEGRYNFKDSGQFILPKKLLERGNISIDKDFDGDVAIDINAKLRIEQARKIIKKNNRDAR